MADEYDLIIRELMDIIERYDIKEIKYINENFHILFEDDKYLEEE